ncbi:hypothetical protein KI659_16825 [Litoribacter alkaliphilus]|uniref:Polysaccharide chain length determinant N-terminal domain-containing protein n=1 Tax=Litoribacter ruber TaxID=702568 RepID=A0AAP2CKM8_9BACT|nr:Wzz/FepE/Etk N-terminal domain-containing protein [Litoribacter alkaliphilus]MBS9525685.1 hypothetical protein [Litoribacter alkaliphilus]
MELSLKEIISRLISNKWVVINTVAIFFIISIIINAFTGKEYTASSKILIESATDSRGLMNQLGNIPGLNLGGLNSHDNMLSSQVYPEILSSNDFSLYILDSKILVGADSIFVREYIHEVYKPSTIQTIKKYTIGIPSLLRKSSTNHERGSRVENNITYLNSLDSRYTSWLRSRVSIDMDRGTQITTVSVESPDASISAQIVQKSIQYLKEYLDAYQTQKEVRNLEFVEERKEEARKNYLQAQHDLASFRDRNRNVLSEVSKIREEVLVQEFNLTNRIYSLLAEQTEQAKIKSKERGVLFKVLERVQLPAPQTKPKSVILTMIFVLTGFIIAVIYILFPLIFNEFYEKDPNGRSKVTV